MKVRGVLISTSLCLERYVYLKDRYSESLTKTQLYAHGAQDRNWFLDMIAYVTKGNPTKGYSMRWERHQLFYDYE